MFKIYILILYPLHNHRVQDCSFCARQHFHKNTVFLEAKDKTCREMLQLHFFAGKNYLILENWVGKIIKELAKKCEAGDPRDQSHPLDLPWKLSWAKSCFIFYHFTSFIVLFISFQQLTLICHFWHVDMWWHVLYNPFH